MHDRIAVEFTPKTAASAKRRAVCLRFPTERARSSLIRTGRDGLLSVSFGRLRRVLTVIKKAGIRNVRIDSIVVLTRRRYPTDRQVETLRKSIRENGVLSPISVRIAEGPAVDGNDLAGRPVLVFGAARLAAAKAEGRQDILAEIVSGTELDFLKAEIAENLHRAELSALERDEQLTAYEKLIQDEARASNNSKRDNGRAKELSAATRRKKVSHRPKGSINPTSRRTAAAELGIDEKTLRRAAKVAGLSSDAKRVACTTGLDKSQQALLAAAAETTAEKQVAKIYWLADRRRNSRPATQESNNSLPPHREPPPEPSPDLVATIVTAWRRADTETRWRVIRELADDLHGLYQEIAPNENAGPRQANGFRRSAAPSGIARREFKSGKSHGGSTSRQYELDLRGAHPASRDASVALQHAN